MTNYELINPSDAYTFQAPDLETATLTVYMISTGYGAVSEDGTENVPIAAFLDNVDTWYENKFGRSIKEALVVKKEEMIDSLNSFVLGNFEDRRIYESTVNRIFTESKKRKFDEEWNDKRTSMNNIGLRTKLLADHLRKQEEAEEEE